MKDFLTTGRQMTPLIIGGIALVLFLAIMLYGLISGRTGFNNEPVPLIKVDQPVKTAPDGVYIRPEPHRDNTVFDVFDENENDDEIGELLQQVEEPDIGANNDLSENDIAQAEPQPAPKADVPKEVIAPTPTPKPAPKPTPAPTPAPAPSATSATPAIKNGYYIQLAAFADESSASDHWQALQSKHEALLKTHPHLVQSWRDETSDKVFYRLLLGPFDDKTLGDNLCERLQKLSQNCFVRQLRAE
ncbi:MAG: SPOR domain-containing protein [Alphaproteobacteria bacterium]|nr:SPOR domain-containing protein [Alphaproteobacteria bacterium]